MADDRRRDDLELPFPEEIERGGRSWEELEDAAHPGDPNIYPPLEKDPEADGEELELP